MPRAKRTLQEAVKNASVYAPAPRSKRTRAATVADGKENEDAPNQVKPAKKNPTRSASGRKQRGKARVRKPPPTKAPVSASDVSALFAGSKSAEDFVLAQHNDLYQNYEEYILAHKIKLLEFLAANDGSLEKLRKISDDFPGNYDLNTLKITLDAVSELFDSETTFGDEFLKTYLPSWIANQGYIIMMARKIDKDDGGENNGFFFQVRELNAISKIKEGYKANLEKLLGPKKQIFNAALVKAAHKFPRELTVNYIAKVLLTQNTKGHSIKNMQHAATGASHILLELSKEFLPMIDPSLDESNYFNPAPSVDVPPILEYLTLPRPWFDYNRQYTEDEREDLLIKDIVKELAEKYNEKPLANFPNYKWVISKPAQDLWDELRAQDLRRNPDNMNMYIYNDFHGYGQQEVVENALMKFHAEFKWDTKSRDSAKMWSVMEGLSFYLSYGNFQAWYMTDDTDRAADTVHMVGYALLVALNHLERDDLLKPNSPLKNIPLVLSLYFRWIQESPDFVKDSNYDGGGVWLDMVALYIRKHNIDIEGLGLYNMDEITMKQPYKDPQSAGTLELEQEKWIMREKFRANKFKFKELWKEFVEDYGHPRSIFHRYAGVGGDHYDITKYPASERMKFSFDKKDPLEGVEF